MSYITVNPNPKRKTVGDCVIRAICIATDKEWDDVYLELMLKGYDMKDIPTANYIWGSYLHDLGFTKGIIKDTCPDCYTIKDFIADNPLGTFVLGTGTHAVTVKDGQLYDSYDSSSMVPVYYWKKES